MNTPDAESARNHSVRGARLRTMADLAIVAIFVAVMYRPLVSTGRTLPTDEFFSDLLVIAQPTFTYTGEELVKGHLPLWNPYWFAGYPHLAMPSASALYPTTVLFGLLPFAFALKIVVLLHCFLAGAFTYAFGRGVFGRRVPALYFAFTAIAGDLVMPPIHQGQIWVLQTLTWFPLAMLLLHRLCGNGGWGSVTGLALTIALMVFGGDPQSLAFCLLFAGFYVAALLVARLWRERAWRGAAARGVMCASGILLGIGLSSIQSIPSRELFAESIRANGVTFEFVTLLNWAARRLFESFLWTTDDKSWTVLVASRCVIALAVSGLVFARQPAAVAAAFAALPCVLYAFMPEWFFDWVVVHLPVYNGVRGAFRMSILVWWAVAYLSAFGVATWTARPTNATLPQRGIAGVTLLALIFVILLEAYRRSSIAPAHFVAYALLAGAATVVVSIARLPTVLRKTVPVLAAAAAMLDLGSTAASIEISGDPAPYALDHDLKALLSSRGDLDRVALMSNWGAIRQGPAVGLLTRDRMFAGYHGLFLMRYARLLRDVAGFRIGLTDSHGRLRDTGELPDGLLTDKVLPLLDLFNVRHLAAINYQSALAESLSRPGGPFTKHGFGSVTGYTNARALPPLFPLHDVVWCSSDDEARALMRDERIDFRRQATMTGTPRELSLRPATALEPITLTAYEPERIAASVELSAPAMVVFSEMFYPGWEAVVDGKRREVECVDTVLRGVLAGEGKHKIELLYRPASFRRGMWLSAGSLAILIGATVMVWARRKRSVLSPPAPA